MFTNVIIQNPQQALLNVLNLPLASTQTAVCPLHRWGEPNPSITLNVHVEINRLSPALLHVVT